MTGILGSREACVTGSWMEEQAGHLGRSIRGLGCPQPRHNRQPEGKSAPEVGPLCHVIRLDGPLGHTKGREHLRRGRAGSPASWMQSAHRQSAKPGS